MRYVVNVCSYFTRFFDTFGGAVGYALEAVYVLADNTRDKLRGGESADTLRTLDTCERRDAPTVAIYADDEGEVRQVATFDASMRGLVGDKVVQRALWAA